MVSWLGFEPLTSRSRGGRSITWAIRPNKPLIFTSFCKWTILPNRNHASSRMLKLHTCTQQTPALIVTAWCAASATLDCVTERWKSLISWQMWPFSAASAFLPQKALMNAHKLTNVTVFCCLSIFATASFWTKWCTKSETWRPWLITLSTGNSIKASWALVHQCKTTRWLDDRNGTYSTECSLTFLE
jgi:hypothetical protein